MQPNYKPTRTLEFEGTPTEEQTNKAYQRLRRHEHYDPYAELTPLSISHDDNKKKKREKLLQEWIQDIEEHSNTKITKIIEK